MEQQTAQMVYAELHTIRETLWRLEREIEHLATLVAADKTLLTKADYLSIVGLGASGMKDVSERHDHYVGEAIAHEHLL